MLTMNRTVERERMEAAERENIKKENAPTGS